MADRLQLGIIGLGNIGQQHIKQVQEGAVSRCRITALASRTPPVTQTVTQTDVAHFQSYRELIDSGLCQAVLIATPTMSHCEIGEYALSRGLHVLMEKPLGLSVGEAEHLLACEQAGKVFGLMLNQRMDPVFSSMKSLLEAGTLGELQRSHWTMTNWFRPEVYFQVSDWRATWRGEGGGLLLNQCIHNLDIFQWLCGMPETINGFCEFGKYHAIEVEDEASAHFRYANGASGMFVGSTGEAPGVNRLDIVGDKGMLSYDGECLTLIENQPGTSQYSRETRDMFGQPQQKVQELTPFASVNQHALLIQNFVDAVLQGTPLIAPAAQGLNSLAIANAILWSAWSGGPVSLPLDSAGYQRALQLKTGRQPVARKSRY